MIRLCVALFVALSFSGPLAAQSAHDLLVGESGGINPRYLLQDPNGRSVSNEDFRGRFQLIAFGYTYCPERDTGKVLKTYTEFFDPRILGLTGSPALVRHAADNFRMRYAKVREPGSDNYAMDHSAGMILLGPDGQFIRKFAFATPVGRISEQLQEILGAYPIAPARR